MLRYDLAILLNYSCKTLDRGFLHTQMFCLHMPIVFGIFECVAFRALVILESSSDWLQNKIPKRLCQVLHRHGGINKALKDPARRNEAPWVSGPNKRTED